MDKLPRSSQASQPGDMIIVPDDEWVDILDADDADAAIKFIIQNDPGGLAHLTLRLQTAADAALAGAVHGQGIMLVPGGHWEESQYAGPVCARGGAAGNVTLVIF